ncbi:transcriptional regulator HexR [Oceanicoccus sp. KOV_DT_Chl]|uniref:transcriptional regulator HexR n=1 Tax=Oceanicoccus sp. KOV_DT_Chl TaxID=1904639 RepID=UPI000C7B28B2|nr:transcriptional regulator HexR [Oceanicoccus sp. KOV_DT_Chl]
MSILSQLQHALPTLSKAESRIAQAILHDPEAIVNSTTAELARRAEVSDPMISRFCRTLGCSSFPDFKVQLAKSLVSTTSFISEAVSKGDDAATYIEKRINANQAALEYIRGKINPTVIQQAVKALAKSKRIEIFGMGGAAAIAKDAQHKLFRLGIPTVAYEDNLMQRMAAASANKDTAVLIFSFTGRTQSMVEVAEIAKQNNAKLITITNPDSPLAKLADITITSGNELEDTTIYVPMTTRIIILTIIDILATGLTLEKGPAIEEQLIKIKHSLDSTKM